MPHTVYKITHRESGRAYIGVTKNHPLVRFAQHTYSAGNTHLRKAIADFGVEAFFITTIAVIEDRENAYAREADEIVAQGTGVPAGYNVRIKGVSVYKAPRKVSVPAAPAPYSFEAVISRWPTIALLAHDMGEKPGTIRQWRKRDLVPALKIGRLADVAAKRGFDDVTFPALTAIFKAAKAA